jgi:site-specific recombinase XerD
MPRRPKFKHRKTPDGWVINVPASITATGKREQHFFQTRDKAKEYGAKLREKFFEDGAKSNAITPTLAEAATAAEALLAPWGASLLDAARFYVTAKERENASKPLAEAVNAWLLSCEGLRDRTLGGYKQTAKKLETALGDHLLAAITAADLQAAACPAGSAGAAVANHYRNARAFWRWSASKGWCVTEVFDGVEAPRTNKDGEIEILAPAEAVALLRVAETHFPQAVASYALQLFAGIRAEELARLEAENVTGDGIELGAGITKKGRRRHITPSKTLAAWLAKYPFAPCPNWRRVDMACRRLAGWAVESEFIADKVKAGELEAMPETHRGSWPQNCLRHSHASYAVASGVPLESLLFEFGHTGTANVLRGHYVGKASKKQALEFFAIRPGGTEASTQLETVESVAC